MASSVVRISIHHRQRPGLSAVYPPPRLAAEPVERIRHTIQVGVVEIGVSVRGDHDRGVAHRHLQEFQIGAGRSRQRGVGVSEIVHADRGMPEFGDPCPPANGTFPVFESEPRALRRYNRRVGTWAPFDPAFKD